MCYTLDTDDYPQIATSYSVERIPTVLLFKDGEKVGSITGTLPKSVYVKAIEKSLSQPGLENIEGKIELYWIFIFVYDFPPLYFTNWILKHSK